MAKKKKGGSKKGKGKKHHKKKKTAQTFPIHSSKSILYPFQDSTRARQEKYKVFRSFVKNRPWRVKPRSENLFTKSTPDIVDTEAFIVETYEQVYYPGQAKPKVGEEYDTGKILLGRDGTRLNQLSVKELQKMIISVHKHKRKETLTTGIAASEKTQMMNQLHLIEARLKRGRLHQEAVERSREDLVNIIKQNNKVYKQKVKYTMSEYHQTLFDAKTKHLDIFLHKHQTNWKQEQIQYENRTYAEENARYRLTLLGQIGKNIGLKGLIKRQIAKEDYLMILQTQLENFDTFIYDLQNEVDEEIKLQARKTDNVRKKNFEEMLLNQERAISEMRKYFQGVNTANSGLIYQLKTEVNGRRARLDRIERDVFVALEEHAKLLMPLHTMEKEIEKMEYVLRDSEIVRNIHKNLWAKEKRLDGIVLRMRWKKELEINRLEKAKARLDQLQEVYDTAALQIARKAGVAQLVHKNTCSLLEEEIGMYQLSHLIMQTFSATGYKTILQRDSTLKQFFDKQEQEIYEFKAKGILLKTVYDKNCSTLQTIFEKKYLRPLTSTGFQFPSFETVLPQNLKLFDRVDEKHVKSLDTWAECSEENSTLEKRKPAQPFAKRFGQLFSVLPKVVLV